MLPERQDPISFITQLATDTWRERPRRARVARNTRWGRENFTSRSRVREAEDHHKAEQKREEAEPL